MFDVQKFTSRSISLEDLPLWSTWPARLLGLTEWSTPKRDIQKVDREYDKDLYLRCLKFAKETPGATSDDVRAHEFRLPAKPVCVSQKNMLYELSGEQIMPADNAMLVSVLTPYMEGVDTVVELGCGYGYNLWELRKHFPKKTFLGGEYSANAVTLAEMLYKGCDNLTVEHFNYYDASYPLLERCRPDAKILLFTRHSIEQLPAAKPFFDTLTKYFPRIVAVVHIEVALENYGDSLIDLLRRRYMAVNDYNRDIVSTLQHRPDIGMVMNEHDVYGLNPLNPSAVIAWKPR